MTAVLSILITADFCWICLQDFKFRQIYLANYLILYLLYLGLITFGNFEIKPYHIILNVHISLIIASMLFVYFLIRYKTKAFQKIKSSVGWGDIMMLPAFIISFSVFNFVIVYMVSLVLSLLYSLTDISNKEEATIPFAGIQAAVLAICFILHVTGIADMQNDIFHS